MSIIISENGANAKKVEESNFELENNLQEYIYANPDVIPLYDIDEDIRLFIAAREFPTKSGPIDALGFDSSGNIYVVETKLFKNPDKRTVVAQALDYGASLWRHSTNFDDFIEQLDKSCQTTFNESFNEAFERFFGLETANDALSNIKNNLSEGKIKFVVLMDKLHEALKDLVVYVNQNSKFDLYAVELEYYKHGSFEVIIPKIYGSEVKKTITSSDDSNRFDNKLILNWYENLENPYVSIDKEYSTTSFLRMTTPLMEELIPRRGEKNGGWRSGSAYYYEIRTERNGYIRVSLVFNSTDTTETQTKGQNKIIAIEDKHPKKPDWVWHGIKSWKVNHQASNTEIMAEIERIITKDIPEFEGRIRESLKA